jgi:photosystem II stability/assembly factor-like uncharacterized protein
MFTSFILSAAVLASAPAFIDPLAKPASASMLAERSPIHAIASTGGRLVAVGQRGHILYGDGATWQQARVPASVDLTAVHFANRESGWAAGHDGLILHSSDGGQSWTRQHDGRAGDAVDERPFLDIWFDGPREGIAVGAFGLARCTVDAGASWRDCKDQFDNPQGLHFNAIRSIDGVQYVTGEQGLLLRRRRGEQRFAPIALPYRGSLFGITGDATQLIVYGLRGNAWRSTDDGVSWQRLDTGGLRSGIAAGLRRSDGSFVLLAQSGQVLRSRDGSQFTLVPLQRIDPVTAAFGEANNDLILAGARGVRRQALPRFNP